MLLAEDSPIRHRPFAKFWCARVLSTLAFQMMSVAVGWQVYTLTGRAFDLGLVGLAQFLPMLCLTLVVGQVADRYDRRIIVSICALVEASAAATLALGSAQGWLDRNLILCIVAAGGAARAFGTPTMAALVPSLVPRDMIPRAAAWTTSATQSAHIVGPALGGVLYVLGPTPVYLMVTTSFAAASLLIAFLGVKPAVRKKVAISLASFFSGISFIRSRRILLGTLSLDLFAVLLGGATALLPIYAHDILHTGPWGLGLLRASPALGALTMSIWLAYRPLGQPVGTRLLAALLVFGAATMLFGLSTWLPLSMVALYILGMSDVVSVVIRFSLVQLQTPDEMLGRVSAINSLFVGTSNQLGEFESGSMAALLGVVPAVLIGGAGTIVVSLIWMFWLFPELRRLKSLEG